MSKSFGKGTKYESYDFGRSNTNRNKMPVQNVKNMDPKFLK